MMQTQLVKKTAIIDSGDFNLSANRYLEKIVINSNFQIVNVSQVAEFVRGITFSKNDTCDEGGLGVLRANNININGSLNLNDIKYINSSLDFSNKKKLLKNDIFICTASGSKKHIGKVAFIEQDYDFYFGGFMGVLRSNDLILPKYLFHILHSSFFRDFLSKTLNTLTINNLNKRVFDNFEFPLPPLEIQEQIVKEIEGYQQIIDGCRKIIENYKPVIDIDPSWEKIPVKSLVKILSGYAFASKLFNDIKGTPIIRIRDIKKGFTKTFYKGDYDKKYLVEDGSLLVGMDGEFNIREWNGGNALLNQRVCKIYEYTGVYKKFFEVLMIKQLKKIENITQAVTVKHISIKQINKIELPVPSMEIQKEIVEKLEQERNIIEGNKELIKIYEYKINARINKVWSDN